MEEQVLQVKWRGNTFEIVLPKSASVRELKEKLRELTQVNPAGQKLPGLTYKGKPPTDEMLLKDLSLKNPHKLMLIGTAQEEADSLQQEELMLQQQRELERIQEEEEEKRYRAEMERRKQELEERRRLEEAERQLQQEMERKRWEELRQKRLQEEIERETDQNATIVLKLNCYSSAFANKPQLETADKMLLPSETLQTIVNNKLALPLTFQVTKATPSTTDSMDVEAKVHGGVLDFSAPKDIAYLPYWMMKKIGVDEGDEILLTNVHLPKGTFAKLQPHNAEWNDIPEKSRRPALEDALRKYSALTVGDSMVIEYNGKQFQFDVLELQPESAVSLTDTDISVELLEPLMESSEVIQTLQLGESVNGHVKQGCYTYYAVSIEDPNIQLSIELNTLKGDANLYVSNSIQRPSMKETSWMAQNVGVKSLLINQQDPQFTTGTYYISVLGYKSDCDFTLTITVEKADQGHQLKDVELSAEDSQLCDNCQKRVPKQSYQMHYVGCIRRNFRCPKCRKVMNTDEKDKHLELEHTPMKCECGVSLEQQELLVHKEHECPLRLVKCIYCGLKIPFNQRGAHQETCGSRTITCTHCGSILKRYEATAHLAKVHDIHSVDLKQSGEFWQHFK